MLPASEQDGQAEVGRVIEQVLALALQREPEAVQ
jgi:hypothetical protein